MRRRADEFTATQGSKALDDTSSKVSQIFGMNEQQLKNAKELLSPPKAELIEKYSERVANINAGESLRNRTVRPDQDAVKGLTGATRRLLETRGRYALDLISGARFNSLTEKNQQKVVQLLTNQNPAALEADLKKVVEILGKEYTEVGVKESVDGLRKLATSFRLAQNEQRGRQSKKNAENNKKLRRKSSELFD